ncbi:MOSC domain-containing protein [Actinomyces radicidentis]|uniref:MOSC domain-containing protein n=1 Tax=Actinomyces radicidentis TaxID=111015 RepID=UPI000A021951|nr:MOSC domain-containing protein [Actinomyces radicidentis]
MSTDLDALRLAHGADAAAVTVADDGTAITPGVLEAALADDGTDLEPLPLARVLGAPHACADGRHKNEPSPFHDGDVVGTVTAVCAVVATRPDAGAAGESSINKAPVDGPVEVHRLGVVRDHQSDSAHHGGPDKALYLLDAAEQEHWAGVLPGLTPGRLGENLLIAPGPAGGIDDVEIGAILTIGDPATGIRARVTGVRNPCPTMARGVGRSDWVETFSERARVGVYLSVLRNGTIQAGDEVRLMVSPGHRVTCTRWFAHHDPRDAQAMLNSEIFGNCVLAPFTRKYVQTASHEQIG